MPASTVDPIYVPFTITTAAATTAAAPLVTTVGVEQGTLEILDLLIPPGHAGRTGFALFVAGVQILPWSDGATWIVGDNLFEQFEVGIDVSSALTVRTFNTGVYAHTHYGRLKIRQLQQSAGIPSLRLIASEQIAG